MTCKDSNKHLGEILAILGADVSEVPELNPLLAKNPVSKMLLTGLNLAEPVGERKMLLRITKLLDSTTKKHNFLLSEVIEEFCGVSIIPFEKMPSSSQKLLQQALTAAYDRIRQTPLLTARPNEAGILFERVLEEELLKLKFKKQRGTVNTKMGYPDIQIVLPETNETVYLECKTHDRKNTNSSLRTFYLSPSLVQKKVTRSGYHLLCALTLERTVQNNKIGFLATADPPVLKDLGQLKIKIKYEYNAGNKEMYK